MAQIITIGSHAHTALTIQDPDNAESTVVINGANHPEATGGAGITKGVDAGLFHRWMEYAERHLPAVLGRLFIVDDEKPAEEEPETAAMDAPQPAPAPNPTEERLPEGAIAVLPGAAQDAPEAEKPAEA